MEVEGGWDGEGEQVMKSRNCASRRPNSDKKEGVVCSLALYGVACLKKFSDSQPDISLTCSRSTN